MTERDLKDFKDSWNCEQMSEADHSKEVLASFKDLQEYVPVVIYSLSN